MFNFYRPYLGGNIELTEERLQHISHNEIKIILSDEDIAKIQALANQLRQSISDLTKEIIHSYLQKI